MARPARIAVIGSANVDLVTFTDRMPRPGETILGDRFVMGWGGKGANQAVAARLCGADVAMVARLGDDLFGPATVANFAGLGIDTTHVRIVPGVSSGVAPIFVDSAGQNRIIVVKGANDRLRPEDVDAAASALSDADCIVLQLEIPLETVYHAIRFASERGIRCILNPAPAQPIEVAAVSSVDYFVPNETEAEALSEIPIRSVSDAAESAKRLLTAGLRRVLITLGSSGVLLAGEGSIEHVPPFPIGAVDTTGAGDAFVGSFATFLSEGLSEQEAIARASLYAAMSTTSIGTQSSFVTRTQFEAEWIARRTP